MTSVVGASSSSLFALPNNWLGDTITAIQNEANQAGLLGMLQNSGGDGSIDSFIGQSVTTSNNFALISQNSVTNTSSFIAQIAAQNLKARNDQKVQDLLKALAASQQQVKAENVLDPTIFFADGSTIDTNNNILTKADGTQYDITTGAKYTDPASIIQLANGAYLDTKNNILTMSDGTRIDTVTGLQVSTSA
jgi:hypothetical protein